MAFSSSISGVAFLGPQQHGLWKGDPSLFSHSDSRCKISKRNARTRSHSMDVRAVAVKPEIDFKDPNWKRQYEEDFDKIFSLPHLKDILDVKPRPTTFSLVSRGPLQDGNGTPKDMRYGYVNDDDRTLLKVIKFASPTSAGAECIDPECSWVEQWIHRAGPRKQIYYEPVEVKAAIVTCGGLCPGLNDVIRQIVFTLEKYGVKRIVGIPFGYRGFFDEGLSEIPLSRQLVQNINLNGGSLLGVSRGAGNITDIVDSIQARGIDMLFVLGGNGTHAGANAIHEEWHG